MTTTKPNILIFMTDQQRGDTILPDHAAKTPHLDQFLKEGLCFREAYCPSPHCCPSRASFFTGLMPSQHGVWHNVNVTNAISRELNEGVLTWSELLADVGYDMRYAGKWHVSAKESPGDRGWKRADGSPYESLKGKPLELWHSWGHFEALDNHDPKASRSEGQILREGYGPYTHYGVAESFAKDERVCEEVVSALKGLKDSSQPWCMYAGFVGPHDPYYVPQRFLDLYDIEDIELPENFQDDFSDRPRLYGRTRRPFDQLTEREHKEAIRHYLAYCSYEDWFFGQVLEALDEQGDAENTCVLYCSDHGDYMGEHGLWCKGLPCFKGAYHVPFAMRWPKGIENPGRFVDEYVSLSDVYPTVLQLAGIDAEDSAVSQHREDVWGLRDGRNLVPFMKDESPENWRSYVYTQSNGNELYGIQRSVMNRKYKLVFNGFDEDELYDLEKDPHEMHNIFEAHKRSALVRELYRELWRFAYERRDGCINPYIMVGLAEFGPGLAFET